METGPCPTRCHAIHIVPEVGAVVLLSNHLRWDTHRYVQRRVDESTSTLRHSLVLVGCQPSYELDVVAHRCS